MYIYVCIYTYVHTYIRICTYLYFHVDIIESKVFDSSNTLDGGRVLCYWTRGLGESRSVVEDERSSLVKTGTCGRQDILPIKTQRRSRHRSVP